MNMNSETKDDLEIVHGLVRDSLSSLSLKRLTELLLESAPNNPPRDPLTATLSAVFRSRLIVSAGADRFEWLPRALRGVTVRHRLSKEEFDSKRLHLAADLLVCLWPAHQEAGLLRNVEPVSWNLESGNSVLLDLLLDDGEAFGLPGSQFWEWILENQLQPQDDLLITATEPSHGAFSVRPEGSSFRNEETIAFRDRIAKANIDNFLKTQPDGLAEPVRIAADMLASSTYQLKIPPSPLPYLLPTSIVEFYTKPQKVAEPEPLLIPEATPVPPAVAATEPTFMEPLPGTIDDAPPSAPVAEPEVPEAQLPASVEESAQTESSFPIATDTVPPLSTPVAPPKPEVPPIPAMSLAKKIAERRVLSPQPPYNRGWELPDEASFTRCMTEVDEKGVQDLESAIDLLKLTPLCAPAYAILSQSDEYQDRSIELAGQAVIATERRIAHSLIESIILGQEVTLEDLLDMYLESRGFLARTMWSARQQDEGIEQALHCYEVAPDNPEVREDLFIMLFDTSRWDFILRLLDASSEMPGTEIAYHQALVSALSDTGSIETVRAIREAVATNPYLAHLLLGETPHTESQETQETEASAYEAAYGYLWRREHGVMNLLERATNGLKGGSE